jgi:short-subunit dehydrogenase
MTNQTPNSQGVRGQIVNIGSVLSILAMPQNGMYSAAKFALRGLSDSLRMELRATGIDVILIMPGHIDTPFFENQIRYDGLASARFGKGAPPRNVARAILRACAHREREVVLTLPAKLGVWTKRFAPRLLDFCLARIR